MGCAHMRMFQYEDAIECFSAAYEHLPAQNTLLDYLTAFYIAKPMEKYMQELNRLQVEDSMGKQVEERVESLRTSITLKDIGNVKEEFLERLTKEYHNSTDH